MVLLMAYTYTVKYLFFVIQPCDNALSSYEIGLFYTQIIDKGLLTPWALNPSAALLKIIPRVIEFSFVLIIQSNYY